MSYAIYKTEAIILRSIPDREANTDVVLFTRDLGKITVRVQAARKIESKMRMQLTRYNHVLVDLVRGAQVWRLTGITQVMRHHVFADNKLLHAWHRAVTLAEHLIRGEEPHPEFFGFLIGLLNYGDQMISQRGTGADHAEALELFAVIKVLDHLGYWPGESFPDIPTDDVLRQCIDLRTQLVAQINDSIKASQII